MADYPDGFGDGKRTADKIVTKISARSVVSPSRCAVRTLPGSAVFRRMDTGTHSAQYVNAEDALRPSAHPMVLVRPHLRLRRVS